MDGKGASLFITQLILLTSSIHIYGYVYPPTGPPSLSQDLSLPCGNTTVSDEFFKFQWYLRGFQPYMTSMNVYKAWQRCYTGKNVIIGIVDGGVYSQNPDLSGQVKDESWTFDPMPKEIKDKSHGTKMAGVIAAKKNTGMGSYGVGIAYDAKLVDIRVLTNHPTVENEALGLNHYSYTIDIYACAFVHFPSGFEIFPLSTKVSDAIESGATKGRGGLGSMYVWSTGNGGDSLIADSCAYEGFCNSPYVIAVAGIDHDLRKIPDGEKCSAMFISALSRAANDRLATLITTKGQSGSTNNFGRNSAAVALIAGAIALALEANPQLQRRDILHLLVQSSRNDQNIPFASDTNDFESNAAGIRVSETFGFGLLDVDTLVVKAKIWKERRMHVGQLRKCPLLYNGVSSSKKQPFLETSYCDIDYIEHVEVETLIQYPNAGQCNIYLIASPPTTGKSETTSLILPSRPLDSSNERNVTVISVKFWGETAHNRKWRLQLKSGYGQPLQQRQEFCTGDRENCNDYGKGVCSTPIYAGWVFDNCCNYCQVGVQLKKWKMTVYGFKRIGYSPASFG